MLRARGCVRACSQAECTLISCGRAAATRSGLAESACERPQGRPLESAQDSWPLEKVCSKPDGELAQRSGRTRPRRGRIWTHAAVPLAWLDATEPEKMVPRLPCSPRSELCAAASGEVPGRPPSDFRQMVSDPPSSTSRESSRDLARSTCPNRTSSNRPSLRMHTQTPRERRPAQCAAPDLVPARVPVATSRWTERCGVGPSPGPRPTPPESAHGRLHRPEARCVAEAVGLDLRRVSAAVRLFDEGPRACALAAPPPPGRAVAPPIGLQHRQVMGNVG